MTPDPEARCVVTRSAPRAITPWPASYDVAKISTTVGPTSRVVVSTVPLKSAAPASRGACARDSAGQVQVNVTAVRTATTQRPSLVLLLRISFESPMRRFDGERL